jgi:AcrR family transcriptional regulator
MAGSSEERPARRTRAEAARDASERRERIIEAAMRHFAEHGYRGGRVEDIAAEVGVAKGTVFLDFASKEGLFLAAYERAVSSLPAWLDAPEEIVGEGFWAILEWWLDRTEEFVNADWVANRVAMIGLVVIIVLYAVTIFHGFMAPYEKSSRTPFIYRPPQALHVVPSGRAHPSAQPGIAEELDRLGACPAATRAIDLQRLRGMVDDWPSSGWERDEVTMPYRYALLRAISAGHFMRRATRSNG